MKAKKNHENIFKKIEQLRSKNNKNWMDILRVAYGYNPKKTSIILSKILGKDQQLIKLANKLKYKSK